MALPLSQLPRRIHLIGIGGDGMSALACYLMDAGYEVSGSDQRNSAVSTHLINRGLPVAVGHDVGHLRGVECVVISDAVLNTNVEVVEARLRDLPIFTRAQCIAWLAKEKETIYIAGAHGKTTTGAMLSHILRTHDSSSSFLLGATVACLNDDRAQFHEGQYLIAEACEAFGNLEPLIPAHVILTNIDDEHLNHYGSQMRLDQAFVRMLGRTVPGGFIVVNGDDLGVLRILTPISKNQFRDSDIHLLTVGFESHNQIRITNYRWQNSCAHFDLVNADQILVQLRLPVPGLHNVSNAALAAVMAYQLGVPIAVLQDALQGFTGADRRWQDYGFVGGVRLIDDYAHHPAEINALFNTASDVLENASQTILIYQPQLISRTQRVLAQTARSLAQWDQVWLLEIDPSGETNSDQVTSAILGEMSIQAGGSVIFFEDLHDVVMRFDRYLKSGDALIVAGAGQIRQLAPILKSQLETVSHLQRSQQGYKADEGSENNLINDNAKIEGPFSLYSRFIQRLGSFLQALQWKIYCHRKSQSVYDLYQWHLDHRPNDLALISPKEHLSYRQLDRYANRLAYQFRQNGMRCGDVVGVRLPSSVALVATVLALSKLGVVYLPLDTNLPLLRLSKYLKIASARFMVIKRDAHLSADLQTIIDLIEIDLSANFKIDDTDPISSESLDGLQLVDLPPAAIAYICFTSGTTGSPKGVPITHGALHHLISQLIQKFSYSNTSRTLINTGIGFDVSVAELWLALTGGGIVVVSDANHPIVGPRLADLLQEFSVSHMAITPSVLRTVPRRPFSTLSCLILAGEVCTLDLVNQWDCAGRQIWNAYGPTEATIYSTLQRCEPSKEPTIGKPLFGTNLYVVNEHNQLLGPGNEGELLIGGKGVSTGYLQDEGIDQSHFFSWKKNGHHVDWVYRTGDLVRKNSNGEFVYLGRRDTQIKFNGVRIEILEIEALLRRQEGIIDAIVVFDSNGQSDQLVAFVVPMPGKEMTTEKLHHKLAQELPSGMIPNDFILIQEVPLNLNGKVDRQHLLEQRRRLAIMRPFFDPGRSNMEKELVKIWEKVLQYQPIGIYDEFQTLGGDSLKLLLLQDEIESTYGVDFPPGFFSNVRNITNLAVQLEEWISQNTSEANCNSNQFENSRIYIELNRITGSWRGKRRHPGSLIVSLGDPCAIYDLFVCVQYEEELVELHNAFGRDYRIHGMRSGHLVMTYTPENIAKLSARYYEELIQIAPSGKVIIAGICQGGTIAHAVAIQLLDRDGIAPPLVLIEQARFPKYIGQVHFFYSKESILNPLNKFHSDLSRLNEIYGEQYTFDVVPGDHGSITRVPYVEAFVSKLGARISR